jgi:hypothetical protein
MGTPRRTQEQFNQTIRDLVSDEYTFLERYENTMAKILVRHNSPGCDYHEYRVTPNKFLQGRRCPHPFCFGVRRLAAWKASEPLAPIPRKTNEAFASEVKRAVGGEYTFLETYTLNRIPLLVRHNSCGHEYRCSPLSFLSNGRRCPVCARRKMRKPKAIRRIEAWLSANGFSFEDEVTYPGLRSGRGKGHTLFFDLRVQTASGPVIVEYDGLQHRKGWMGNPKRLASTIANDTLKNAFCLANGMRMIRLNDLQERDLELHLASALERSTTIPVEGVRCKPLAAEMEVAPSGP